MLQEFSFIPKDIVDSKPINVTVAFTSQPYFGKMKRTVMYCTIQIIKDKKYQYYHGGIVWNNKDNYDEIDAMFLAHKDALEHRYIDAVVDYFAKSNDLPDVKPPTWDTYFHHWSKFLWRLINGEIIDNPNLF